MLTFFSSLEASTCLLHAVVATAGRMVPDAVVADDLKYWPGGKDEFAAYHAEKAATLLTKHFAQVHGRKGLQVSLRIVTPVASALRS